jgi:hypothetical protein
LRIHQASEIHHLAFLLQFRNAAQRYRPLRFMSAHQATSHFVLRGEYCGFIRTLLGKKRMVLRVAGEEHFLKVEKDLRHRVKASVAMGTEIVVEGAEEIEEGRVGAKRVVSTVRMAGAEGSAICMQCPIRVCTKNKCWHHGGKELWKALEETIAHRGLGDEVQLEGVHCLDHCKKGPNAEWEGHDFHYCTPRDAARIVATVAGKE